MNEKHLFTFYRLTAAELACFEPQQVQAAAVKPAPKTVKTKTAIPVPSVNMNVGQAASLNEYQAPNSNKNRTRNTASSNVENTVAAGIGIVVLLFLTGFSLFIAVKNKINGSDDVFIVMCTISVISFLLMVMLIVFLVSIKKTTNQNNNVKSEEMGVAPIVNEGSKSIGNPHPEQKTKVKMQTKFKIYYFAEFTILFIFIIVGAIVFQSSFWSYILCGLFGIIMGIIEDVVVPKDQQIDGKIDFLCFILVLCAVVGCSLII